MTGEMCIYVPLTKLEYYGLIAWMAGIHSLFMPLIQQI